MASKFIDQLGFDYTVAVIFLLFMAVYIVMSQLYFKPMLALIDARHKKTVEDKEAAGKLSAEADSKYAEYQERILAAREDARQAIDDAMSDARRQENEALTKARAEAKELYQKTAAEIDAKKSEIRGQLKQDVEALSRDLSEQLLMRDS